MNFTTLLIASGVALAVPMILAALGECISESAGVLNIELEGMMLCGALGGVWAAHSFGNLFIGFVGGALAGVLLGAIHGLLCLRFGANQAVSGVVLNTLALGVTAYVHTSYLSSANTSVGSVLQVDIPLLSRIPRVGEMFFQQDLVVYLTFLAVPAVWWLLSRTSTGLTLRAVGEDPASASALGIDVRSTRWLALIACSILAGLGGAQLALGSLGFFTPNMTGGRGFIALAAVILAGRRPFWATAAVLLFALADALAVRANALGVDVPRQLLAMLPYVLTLFALVFLRRGSRQPAALGMSYQEA